MRLRGPSGGYLWSAGEDEQLRGMLARGKTLEEASRILNRSVGAVRKRASKRKLCAHDDDSPRRCLNSVDESCYQVNDSEPNA